jgi:hypothetical protein
MEECRGKTRIWAGSGRSGQEREQVRNLLHGPAPYEGQGEILLAVRVCWELNIARR